MERVPFLGRLKLIKEWLPRDAGRVLEVGCSWGYLLGMLEHGSVERYGLDINVSDLKQAVHRFEKRARYVCAAAESLPFPNGFFDAVIMSEVLEHTINEGQSLFEVARVLRPGGTVVLTVPHRGPMELTDLTNWKYRLPALHRLAYRWKHRGDLSQFVPVTQYHRHYTIRHLSRLVASQFDITALRRGGFLVFALADYAALARSPGLARTLFKLAIWDYGINYGPLSYNVAVRLRKREA